jgi:archaellum component FlaG (FlaF/FlaG flagellin family)
MFTADYIVPDGVNPVENTATASGMGLQEPLVESDPAVWSVDIIHPDIEVTKEANPTVAHESDIITYTISVKNTGDCELSKVSVTDDHGTPVYDSGDVGASGKLDVGETWVYTCSGPAEADDFTNTAEATFEDDLGFDVSDSGTADVEVLNPAIEVEKSADTDAAAPGETVTYTILLKNMGDCELSVHVVDELLGIDRTITLAAGVDVSADFEYIIPDDAPEYVENTVTATGTDAIGGVGGVVEDQDDWTVHTMGARTIGYWKNHENWCGFPRGLPEESIFYYKPPAELLEYFPGNGIEENGVNPLEMLRVQLLAAELNYACSEDDFHYARYEAADIFGIMREAEAFLQRVYGAAGHENLNTYWSTLTKKQQNNVKQIANPLKDVLDTFNNMGDEIWE